MPQPFMAYTYLLLYYTIGNPMSDFKVLNYSEYLWIIYSV